MQGRTTLEQAFDEKAWRAAAEENRRLSDEQTLEAANVNIMVPDKPIEPPREIPGGGHAEAFLRREAERDGVSLADKRREVEAAGFGAYVLDGLKRGRIGFTEAWNALETSFIEVLRLAYSNGATELTPDDIAMFTGRPNKLAETIRSDPRLVFREIAFTPSFDPDGASPQFAEIAYDPQVRNAPVVICQHGGYPGSRLMELGTMRRLAAQGVFAIAVSKRGRDGSAGRPDAWGTETADIVDALDHCARHYADHLDPTNVTVRGGSGGGLDAISLLVRYPDRFRCVVAFFGYAELIPMIEQAFSPQADALLKADPRTAGSIRAVRRFAYGSGYGRPGYPDRRLARTLTLAAETNPYAQVHFVWDEDDPLSPMMDRWFEEFRAAAERMGSRNVHLHRSRRGDTLRYPHWMVPDNDAFDRFYLPAILSRTVPAPVLAPAGVLTVPGFLKTRRFEIVLGAGDDAVARVGYELGVDEGTFHFRRLSSDPAVRGVLRFHNPRRRPLAVRINGTLAAEPSTREWVECGVGLDDSVVIGVHDRAGA